ncbi:MAG TPA: hypothetical protein VE646_08930 [Actinomycetota bacterium]|jgi:hypothetical protein|nr:hypothetical protein [Actinomycetota bacterium]
MPDVHEVVGFSVVALFTLGWLWGIALWALRRGAGSWFWRWLALAQIVAGLQAVLGIALLVLGYRPDTWLHLVYGFGPLIVLGFAHVAARTEMYAERPWTPFAWGSFICFGLTLRALMTGLGIG